MMMPPPPSSNTSLCQTPLLSQFSTLMLNRWGLMSNLLLLEISHGRLATKARGKFRAAFNSEGNATWSSMWRFCKTEQVLFLLSAVSQASLLPGTNKFSFSNSFVVMEGLREALLAERGSLYWLRSSIFNTQLSDQTWGVAFPVFSTTSTSVFVAGEHQAFCIPCGLIKRSSIIRSK